MYMIVYQLPTNITYFENNDNPFLYSMLSCRNMIAIINQDIYDRYFVYMLSKILDDNKNHIINFTKYYNIM